MGNVAADEMGRRRRRMLHGRPLSADGLPEGKRGENEEKKKRRGRKANAAADGS